MTKKISSISSSPPFYTWKSGQRCFTWVSCDICQPIGQTLACSKAINQRRTYGHLSVIYCIVAARVVGHGSVDISRVIVWILPQSIFCLWLVIVDIGQRQGLLFCFILFLHTHIHTDILSWVHIWLLWYWEMPLNDSNQTSVSRSEIDRSLTLLQVHCQWQVSMERYR